MCETGHSNLTFTTVEQKIALEYLEAYLRYSILLKTAQNCYFKQFEHFAAIEILEIIKFTSNHYDYM